MITAPRKLLSVAVAGVFATTLFMTAHVPTQAHHASASLPTLRLDYFEGANGKLSKTLDPALVTSAVAADTIAMVNANLVHILPNNKVAGDLATHWTVSKDHKTYTFFLRKARYSNGHTVKASDFVYSIKRSLDPATQSPVATTYLFMITGANDFNAGKSKTLPGVKALNATTLRIHIDKPFAFFLKALTYPTSDALDPTVLSGKISASSNNYLTNTCTGNQGAGPFKFVCQNSSSTLNSFYPAGQTPKYTLVPNKYYYGKKPKIRVELPAYSTTDIGYRAYLAGDIDATGIPTEFLSKWKKNKQYLAFDTSIVSYITPNTHMAPMNNSHCRAAVGFALDRNTIINKVLHGASRPIYDVVPPGFLGYYSGKDNPHYNLAKAKAEVAAGHCASTKLSYTYPTGSSDADNAANAIVAMLSAAGFNASIHSITANDWYTVVSEALDKTQTQLVRNGWQQDYPDPQDYVTLLLRSGEDYNIGQWKNAKFDALVDRADIEPNNKKRAQLYIQAQHIALNQGAWISYSNAVGHSLIKPYVHGLVGTVAYGDLVPKNYDWSLVTVKH